ncbi:hypothetical protein AMAG_07651 [Allomyces macrogynus ATCC 38327]|uniref:Proline-rich protein PRCC n=1 Tax=Allomyces macrogynus (strain ATCC 38327) TaxID=578462 RepID=A0A0L0SIX2_ALLM3|nr:hypothetical protein AMAG_07651 [Allomyces macrogynus ATCC 38327]|eukprot:KNE62432.1 hypothetical protein AMAG_07651 [Allomyces macrogynus ATCC 38327]
MSRLLANYSSSDDDESDREIPTIPAKRPPSPAEKIVPADPSASSWLGTAKKQQRAFGPVTFVVGDSTKDDDADEPPSPPRPVTGGAKRGGGAGLFAFLPAPKNTSSAGTAGSSAKTSAGDKDLAPPSAAKASLAPPSAVKAGAGKRAVVKVASAGAAPCAELPGARPDDDGSGDVEEVGPASGPAPAPAPAPAKAAPAPVAKKLIKLSSSLFSFGGASSPLPLLPEPSVSFTSPTPALSSHLSSPPTWPLDPAAPHPSSAYAVAHPSEAYAYGASSSSSSSAAHPPAPVDDVTQQLGIDRSDLRKLGISDKQLRQSSIAVRSVNVRESLAAEDLEQVSQAHLAAAPKPINQAMSASTKLSIMALAKKAVSQQGDMEQMFSANRVKKRIASKKYGF